MITPIRRRRLRWAWAPTAILLVSLLNTAFSAGPVLLKRSEGVIGPAFVVFSPDGRWIAANIPNHGGGAGHCGEILVWDFATKEKVATYTSQPDEETGTSFLALVFSPDSRLLATTETGGRVCLWDGSKGWRDAAAREVFPPEPGRNGSMRSSSTVFGTPVAFSPDGTLLAVPRRNAAGRSELVKIVRVDTGEDVAELDAHGSVQFADEGKGLVVTGPIPARKGHFVRFWNMETFEEVGPPLRVEPPPGFGKRLAAAHTVLSPLENMLAVTTGATGMNWEVRLYELPSRRAATLVINPHLMLFPSFSPDGRLLAVSTQRSPGDPAAVMVWDLTTRVWRRFDCPAEIAMQNITCYNTKFSPDGRYLAAGLWHPSAAVCIWDLQDDATTGR